MKLLSTNILFTVIMSTASVSALAYDVAEKNAGNMIYYNYINDGKELEVVGAFDGITYTGTVVIPEKAAGLNVTAIGQGAFAYSYNLSSVTIPQSVITIDKMAFYGCESLSNIIIPKSVTSIATGAFEGNGLTFISVEEGNPVFDSRKSNAIIETASNTLIVGCSKTTIPNTVTAIGDYAFSEVKGMTTNNIPESVTYIGAKAFSGCHDLSDITLPKSMTYIGPGAFYNCTSLTSFTIPDGVDSICSETFATCVKLTSVNIPNSVKSIGEHAFSECRALTSINIPNSVIVINGEAFTYCESLASVLLPESVTSLESGTFAHCYQLTSFIIPETVTSIGAYVFSETSLTSIVIPPNVTFIHGKAFHNVDFQTVVSLIEEPFDLSLSFGGPFTDKTVKEATLYVPIGLVDKYKETEGWKDFNIIEENTSGIKGLLKDNRENALIHDLNGRVLSHPRKGFNIIGGKKVIVK